METWQIENGKVEGTGGGNTIAAGPGILSDVSNNVQTLSLDPDYRGSGQWVPLVVYQFGGAMFQFSPSLGTWAYANYGANGNGVGEGAWDYPLARAQSASKMVLRLEYTSDSDVSLRLRRRRGDTDSWARFENNLIRYRASSSRANNTNLPVWGNWQTGNPVSLIGSPTWIWYEFECTTSVDDEIGLHFAPQAGVVNWGYFRLYGRI